MELAREPLRNKNREDDRLHRDRQQMRDAGKNRIHQHTALGNMGPQDDLDKRSTSAPTTVTSKHEDAAEDRSRSVGRDRRITRRLSRWTP